MLSMTSHIILSTKQYKLFATLYSFVFLLNITGDRRGALQPDLGDLGCSVFRLPRDAVARS